MTNLTIVSGFLGAGKTTLLSQLIARSTSRAERCVVIENEFGSIGFDAALLARAGVQVHEINQGCVCCSLQVAFAETLERVLADPAPDRVFFEPSGIYIPDRLLDVLHSPACIQRCHISSFITVIDAQCFSKSRRSYGSFFQRQAEFADIFAISKTESLDALAIEDLQARLRRINPRAPQTIVSREHTSTTLLDGLLDANRLSVVVGSKSIAGFSEPRSTEEPDQLGHRGLESITCNLHPTILLPELEEILTEFASGRFGKIVRAKGTLANGVGKADFSLVSDAIEISLLSHSGPGGESSPVPGHGKIVVIGEALDKERIKARLRDRSCGPA